jgi:serine/threonine protein phosphatase PrpC
MRLQWRQENLQSELKNLQEEMKDLKAALVLLFDLGKKYQWLADNPEFFHYFLLEKNRLQAESASKSDQTHKPPVQQSQDLKQGSELRDLAKTVLSTENIREILRDKNGKHGKRLPKIEEIYRKKAGIAETARHMDKLMDDRFGGDHSEQILINGLNAYFAGKAGVNPKRTQEDGGLVGLVKRGFDLKDPKQVAVDLKKIFEEQARKFRESWARRILEKSVLAQPKAASKAAQENKKKSPPANAVKPKEESEPQVVPGSTAIGALYSPNDKILTLVNAGDSRAVAIIMNQDQSAVKDVVRLTCDHKPQNPDEKLRIKGLGGRVVGNKIFFKKGDYLDCEISVSRSAGDSDAVNSHGEHLVSSEFEVFQYEAALMCKEKGDQVLLLLTCDGPYEVVNEKTLQVLLEWWAESKDVREQWENNLADYIISWAIILGSCDNNSAFVVDLFKCNKAFFAGIFDGHGGHQASQYLTENIAKHLLDLDQEKFKAFLPRPSLAVENPSGSKAASAKGLVVASV